MEPEEKPESAVQENTIKVNLMGIKHMKTSHVWRLEFDVYEVDSQKIKALIDQIEKDFYLLLVPIDKEPENS
jgi:hypothetical protein